MKHKFYITLILLNCLFLATVTQADSTNRTTLKDVKPVTAICNNNGICDGSESCGTCSADCGVCTINRYTKQQPKYLDLNCAFHGNGLTDNCATSNSGSGRYNDIQAALNDLTAGDTLYIAPGNYFRDGTPRDSGGLITVTANGTSDQPIILTAADQTNLPVIHSCDPSNLSYCPGPALVVHSDYVIVDHLAIRGRAQIWGGSNSVMQYLDASHGWGWCGDGNWAVLRVENGDSNSIRFNYVHDISGAGLGESCLSGQDPFDQDDRGSGLKEFTSTNTLWEFNTVVGAPHSGYDLHRNSVNSTIRFNRFEANRENGVRIVRARNVYIYGNILLGAGNGGVCIDSGGVNETSPGLHRTEIFNNTCANYGWGINLYPDVPNKVYNNVVYGLVDPYGARNINAPGAEHTINHNAWDSNASYHTAPWDESKRWYSLDKWQRLGHDKGSHEGPGGYCSFVNAPAAGNISSYDLHITGACQTIGVNGSEVGAYGITNCVGYKCNRE